MEPESKDVFALLEFALVDKFSAELRAALKPIEQRLTTLERVSVKPPPLACRRTYVAPPRGPGNFNSAEAPRADTEDLPRVYRCAENAATSPLDLVLAQSYNVKQYRDWPFLGTAGAARVNESNAT